MWHGATIEPHMRRQGDAGIREAALRVVYVQHMLGDIVGRERRVRSIS